MSSKRYRFVITGRTPLIMHADSIDWADKMEAWKNDAKNKQDSRAGDDRTPAFRWTGCLYMDEKHVVIPSDYITRMLMGAAARVPIPGGRNGKTFKQGAMSGMMVEEPHIALLVGDGKQPIPREKIDALLTEKDFDKHRSAASKLGFNLFVKRAKIGQSKHIRVRPKFDKWGCTGHITVWDDKLAQALPEIAEIAMREIGLGDWRPSASTPGPYGCGTMEVAHA